MLTTQLGVSDAVLFDAFERTRRYRGTGRPSTTEESLAAVVDACGVKLDRDTIRRIADAHIRVAAARRASLRRHPCRCSGSSAQPVSGNQDERDNARDGAYRRPEHDRVAGHVGGRSRSFRSACGSRAQAALAHLWPFRDRASPSVAPELRRSECAGPPRVSRRVVSYRAPGPGPPPRLVRGDLTSPKTSPRSSSTRGAHALAGGG